MKKKRKAPLHQMASPSMASRYKEFDVAIGQLFRKARGLGHTIPCSRGCDACCYDAAFPTHLEMPPLVETLRAMAVEKRAAVKRRIIEWFDKMDAAGLKVNDSVPNRSAYFRARLACPLLDREKHECMAYNARPIACRGHHIVDATPAVCAAVGEDPWVPSLKLDEITVPFLQALFGDQRTPPGEEMMLAVALLPAMLWAVWPLVEHPELSITEWLVRTNREGLKLSPPAKEEPRAG